MATNFMRHKSIFSSAKHNIENTDTENSTTTSGRRSISRRLTQPRFSTGAPGIRRSSADRTSPVDLNVFTYDENSSKDENYKNVKDIPGAPLPPIAPITWIDVNGVHDNNIIDEIGHRYDIHSLVLGDIKTTDQRTKLDVLNDSLFLVCKVVFLDIKRPEPIVIEQISFYLKDNLLITFQQSPKDLFDSIKNRIRHGKGRIRRSKVDYLFYSLLDVIVDHYMDVLDTMGTKVEDIDSELMTKTLKRNTLESIYDLKHRMLYFRAIVSPLKEIIIKLQKEEETQIMQESTYIYLKDLFDHVVQVNDSVDTYREMLASFIDFYMMLNSNAMNQVVKTLTIISTIFIPLTFISGVYGMNFQNMPELRYENGYYIVLSVMACLAIFMLSCFKRNHWF